MITVRYLGTCRDPFTVQVDFPVGMPAEEVIPKLAELVGMPLEEFEEKHILIMDKRRFEPGVVIREDHRLLNILPVPIGG